MKRKHIKKYFVSALMVVLIISILVYTNHSSHVNNVLASIPITNKCVVIDAGHGGEDGGAVSASGTVESHINLSIALRLDEIFGLYGVNSILLRDSDISLHDSNALTLREKKVSDLYNRTAAIEALEDPIVISIHQNTFPNSKYHGAQVFYANGDLSFPFAQITQDMLRKTLDPENNRKPAAVPETVYLMNHITCRAILVECGFLSNPQEDALLQSPEYQTKLAAALAGAYLQYQHAEQEGESYHAAQSENSFLLY